jgi:hypothetical protein
MIGGVLTAGCRRWPALASLDRRRRRAADRCGENGPCPLPAIVGRCPAGRARKDRHFGRSQSAALSRAPRPDAPAFPLSCIEELTASNRAAAFQSHSVGAARGAVSSSVGIFEAHKDTVPSPSVPAFIVSIVDAEGDVQPNDGIGRTVSLSVGLEAKR